MEDETTEYRQTPYEPPAGATEVLLVRHGASQPARPGTRFDLVDGQGDPDLAPEGREQADLVGERLAAERVDAIYVTTLRRTVQTAGPLARRTDLTPVVEADLREVHLGEWEGGLFREKVARQDPIAMRMWAEERWDVVPGAETGAEFAARVRRGLGRIAKSHPDGRIAVFTHGGVIAQALADATGARPFAFLAPDNCSISRLVVLGEGWAVRGFNDVTHLPHSAPAPLT